MSQAAAFCIVALLAALAGVSASPYDPHAPDDSVASWFEGWYLRVLTSTKHSDPSAPSSLGVITGYAPHGDAAWNTSLVEVIIQPGDLAGAGHSKPAIYTRTGLQLNVTTGDGAPVHADPVHGTPPDFTVRDVRGGFEWSMQGERCSVAVRLERASLYIECAGPPAPWGPNGWGPEGWAASVPTRLTGIHWFVHSLGTPVHFTLVEDGRAAVTGQGLAHMEKNWGRGFPDGWAWAQGAGTQAAFALAGGQVPSPWVPAGWLPDAWLLGVRTSNYSWDLRAYDTIFTTQSAPCSSSLVPNSTFNITAVQPLFGREVRLEISAAPESFAETDCPTQQGFWPLSVETYTATATLRLFQWEVNTRGGKEWLQKRLLEALTLDRVALEFGGDRRCLRSSALDAEGKGGGGELVGETPEAVRLGGSAERAAASAK